MVRSVDDPQIADALLMLSTFTTQGQTGLNLIKALQEEGLIERSAFDQLKKQFSETLNSAGAPAKAVNLLYSLFTGNIVGASMSSLGAIKSFFNKKDHVDTGPLH